MHPGERTVHQPVSGLLRRGDSVFLYVHENVVRTPDQHVDDGMHHA